MPILTRQFQFTVILFCTIKKTTIVSIPIIFLTTFQGTPLQVIRSSIPSHKNKSLGDSIKKHIFHKNLIKNVKKAGFTQLKSSSSEELLNVSCFIFSYMLYLYCMYHTIVFKMLFALFTCFLFCVYFLYKILLIIIQNAFKIGRRKLPSELMILRRKEHYGALYFFLTSRDIN